MALDGAKTHLTVLLLLYFNSWYLFILAVNAALIVGIALMNWPGGRRWGREQRAKEFRSARGGRCRSPRGPRCRDP
jgi:hypothetical protein